MKSIIKSILLLMTLSSALNLKAQTLEENLTSAFIKLDTAKTLSEMMSISSKFDLIANQYSDQWAADYYAAYSKATISFAEPDNRKKDLLIDEAEKYFSKIKTVLPDSSEKFVLAALIINARISVDGKNRGREYGDVFDQTLKKAKAINPDNPRIYYLKGTSLFYTPKLFGGGKNKAREYFDRATPLFEKQKENSILIPYWGKKQNSSYLSQCK
jgi:hypothetical protein